jgi:hypothetical protein
MKRLANWFGQAVISVDPDVASYAKVLDAD